MGAAERVVTHFNISVKQQKPPPSTRAMPPLHMAAKREQAPFVLEGRSFDLPHILPGSKCGRNLVARQVRSTDTQTSILPGVPRQCNLRSKF